ELCGGTHVRALGTIGPIKIVSEGSIGANLRRIEALTGAGALEHFHGEEAVLTKAAELLRARPDEIPQRIERTLEELRELQDEVKALKRQGASQDAPALAAEAREGVVVAPSDTSGAIATPREVLRRTGDPAADRAAIVRAVEELEAELVIVGLPLSLDGSMGPAARAAAVEAEALRAVLSVPVETYD